MADRTVSQRRPIVIDARVTVGCSLCDFKVDSNQRDLAAALQDVTARHNHPGRRFRLEAAVVDYKENPLFVGRFVHADTRPAPQTPDPEPDPGRNP